MQSLQDRWNRSDEQWFVFFGNVNQKVFRKVINEAIDRIENPEDDENTHSKPINIKETIQLQSLSLSEIGKRYPWLENIIRNEVLKKYTNSNDEYLSAMSGYKKQKSVRFQIDHIVPLAHGGLSVTSNLQLLTRSENAKKSDSILA